MKSIETCVNWDRSSSESSWHDFENINFALRLRCMTSESYNSLREKQLACRFHLHTIQYGYEDHPRYGVGQWKQELYSNASSHWMIPGVIFIIPNTHGSIWYRHLSQPNQDANQWQKTLHMACRLSAKVWHSGQKGANVGYLISMTLSEGNVTSARKQRHHDILSVRQT